LLSLAWEQHIGSCEVTSLADGVFQDTANVKLVLCLVTASFHEDVWANGGVVSRIHNFGTGWGEGGDWLYASPASNAEKHLIYPLGWRLDRLQANLTTGDKKIICICW